MKISKYIHSCLLFELEGHKLLFDPGNFTFAEGLVTPETFADVNSIIITHIHPDHLDIENLKKIVALSKAPIYTNMEVGTAIQKSGLNYNLIEEGIYKIGPFKLKAIPVVHEPLLDNPIPQMTGFIINDKVLHPVDSMEDKLTQYHGIELFYSPLINNYFAFSSLSKFSITKTAAPISSASKPNEEISNSVPDERRGIQYLCRACCIGAINFANFCTTAA
jgi:L-ascorbate metabolism protein UlaG (beta-lactamase superfamily)